jgi:MoaA/NifB/PqqE/SkfB family radical SAM enzyme
LNVIRTKYVHARGKNMGMSLFKKAQAGVTVMKARLLNRRYPLLVTLRPSYKCNFTCSYCKVWQEKTDEMKLEDYYKTIDRLAELGTQKVGFAGGEPLMWPNIGKVIQYAHSKGLFTSMSTNASLLAKRIDEVQDLDLITISLDGREEAHDKNRQQGSFKKVIEAIKLARERGIKVWTITVLNKDNLNDVDFIVDLAEEIGFSTIFQPIYFHKLTGDVDDLYPKPEELRVVIRKLMKYKKEGRPISTSIKFLQYMMNWPELGQWEKCWAGKLFWTLTPDGQLYSCGGAISHVKNPMNIFDMDIQEAIDKTYNFADSCRGCWFNCYMENNFLLNLNPDAIWNTLKKLS